MPMRGRVVVGVVNAAGRHEFLDGPGARDQRIRIRMRATGRHATGQDQERSEIGGDVRREDDERPAWLQHPMAFAQVTAGTQQVLENRQSEHAFEMRVRVGELLIEVAVDDVQAPVPRQRCLCRPLDAVVPVGGNDQPVGHVTIAGPAVQAVPAVGQSRHDPGLRERIRLAHRPFVKALEISAHRPPFGPLRRLWGAVRLSSSGQQARTRTRARPPTRTGLTCARKARTCPDPVEQLMSFDRERGAPVHPARRRFVRGLAAAGVLAGAGAWPSRASFGAVRGAPLSGTEFDLVIGETPANFTGRTRTAITVNGSIPAPLLRWKEGTTVNLRVSNALPAGSNHGQEASIHWHGILLPANMDGVPGISFNGIARGETYQYRFTVKQGGTYWYHSHSGFQEQAGLYGPLVIDPVAPDPFSYDREHVVMLTDWTDLDPTALFARLKKMPGYDNYYKRTVADFMRDVRRDGASATLADRGAWGRMRMTPTDLSDVNAHTYTYLMNRS